MLTKNVCTRDGRHRGVPTRKQSKSHAGPITARLRYEKLEERLLLDAGGAEPNDPQFADNPRWHAHRYHHDIIDTPGAGEEKGSGLIVSCFLSWPNSRAVPRTPSFRGARFWPPHPKTGPRPRRTPREPAARRR